MKIKIYMILALVTSFAHINTMRASEQEVKVSTEMSQEKELDAKEKKREELFALSRQKGHADADNEKIFLQLSDLAMYFIKLIKNEQLVHWLNDDLNRIIEIAGIVGVENKFTDMRKLVTKAQEAAQEAIEFDKNNKKITTLIELGCQEKNINDNLFNQWSDLAKYFINLVEDEATRIEYYEKLKEIKKLILVKEKINLIRQLTQQVRKSVEEKMEEQNKKAQESKAKVQVCFFEGEKLMCQTYWYAPEDTFNDLLQQVLKRDRHLRKEFHEPRFFLQSTTRGTESPLGPFEKISVILNLLKKSNAQLQLWLDSTREIFDGKGNNITRYPYNDKTTLQNFVARLESINPNEKVSFFLEGDKEPLKPTELVYLLAKDKKLIAEFTGQRSEEKNEQGNERKIAHEGERKIPQEFVHMQEVLHQKIQDMRKRIEGMEQAQAKIFTLLLDKSAKDLSKSNPNTITDLTVQSKVLQYINDAMSEINLMAQSAHREEKVAKDITKQSPSVPELVPAPKRTLDVSSNPSAEWKKYKLDTWFVTLPNNVLNFLPEETKAQKQLTVKDVLNTVIVPGNSDKKVLQKDFGLSFDKNNNFELMEIVVVLRSAKPPLPKRFALAAVIGLTQEGEIIVQQDATVQPAFKKLKKEEVGKFHPPIIATEMVAKNG